MISSAMDHVGARRIALPVLNHPGVQVVHCDRILDQLNVHESKALEPWVTGVRAEYVIQREVLRLLETGVKPGSDDNGNPVERTLTREQAARLIMDATAQSTNQGAQADPKAVSNLTAILARYSRSDFAKEREIANDLARAMLEPGLTIHADRERRFKAWLKAHPRGPGFTPPCLVYLTLSDFLSGSQWFGRDALFIRAVKCQAAVRRWQLTHDGRTGALADMCRAAGLPGVPVDPFSGKPLLMTTASGEPVIYSVGIDGRDDRGQKDADLGRNPEGDFLFPLPNLKRPGR
jgi:hypothetical protein